PGDLVELLKIQSDMCDVLAVAGRYAEALAHARASLELARKVQSPVAIGASLYNVAWVNCVLGHWREAIDAATEAFQRAERVDFGAGNLLYLHMWAGRSAAYLGDRAGAEGHIAAVED